MNIPSLKSFNFPTSTLTSHIKMEVKHIVGNRYVVKERLIRMLESQLAIGAHWLRFVSFLYINLPIQVTLNFSVMFLYEQSKVYFLILVENIWLVLILC